MDIHPLDSLGDYSLHDARFTTWRARALIGPKFQVDRKSFPIDKIPLCDASLRDAELTNHKPEITQSKFLKIFCIKKQ